MKNTTAMETSMVMLNRLALCFLMAITAYLLMINPGFAAPGDGVVNTMSNVKGVAVRIVEPLGIIAIITLGIAAMFGRITWTQALIVAVGIAVATGAADLFGQLSYNAR